MKVIYVSENLLSSMLYNYNDLENKLEDVIHCEYTTDFDETVIYCLEVSDDDSSRYLLENIKSAYKQANDIFEEMDNLETANERECYLYSIFGETPRVSNIFNHYMRDQEIIAKRKMFWLVLENLDN